MTLHMHISHGVSGSAVSYHLQTCHNCLLIHEPTTADAHHMHLFANAHADAFDWRIFSCYAPVIFDSHEGPEPPFPPSPTPLMVKTKKIKLPV